MGGPYRQREEAPTRRDAESCRSNGCTPTRHACGASNVATRVTVAIVGDTIAGLAALEVTSYVACAGVALAYTRRAQSGAPGIPFDDVMPSRPEPNLTTKTLEASGLTDRERQVLDMAIHGLTAKQIGERLYISRRTVETHLGRARDKLGVRTKRELIAQTYDTRGETQTAVRLPRAR